MRAVRGRIFDLQRNSYADGPGIRTAVFFKGCNLRCLWCHNPEGLRPEKQYAFFRDACVECGVCARRCPRGAILEIGQPDADKCALCGACASYCPKGAIRIYGRDVTAGEVFDTIARDRAYYDLSGGGVTFTGGECMLQMEFLCALLALCREAGIHTAVDTAGNVPLADFRRAESLADIFLFDVKAANAETHKRLTGVGNEKILANLRWLLTNRPEKAYLRVPVIPGANDAPDVGEMENIARLLAGMPRPKEIRLLPYHAMGEGKRRALGAPTFTARAPDEAHMQKLRATEGLYV